MLIRASIVFGVLALAATAALAKPANLPIRAGGTYAGEYTCTQGITGMTIDMRSAGAGKVEAVIVYYEHPDNPGVPSGCFFSKGTVDANGRVKLEPDHWILQPSPDWEMTRMDGTVRGAAFSGDIIALSGPSGCTTFNVRRNATPFKAPPKECTLPQAIS
jgi:hypothetical protein